MPFSFKDIFGKAVSESLLPLPVPPIPPSLQSLSQQHQNMANAMNAMDVANMRNAMQQYASTINRQDEWYSDRIFREARIERDLISDSYTVHLQTEYGTIAKKYRALDEVRPGVPLFRLTPEEQQAHILHDFTRDAFEKIKVKEREKELKANEARLARQRRIVAVYNYQIEQGLWTPRIGSQHACMDWLPGDPPLPDGTAIGRLGFSAHPAQDNAMSNVRVGVVVLQDYERDQALADTSSYPVTYFIEVPPSASKDVDK